MSQNSLRMSWTREEVDSQLEGIMKLIHRFCCSMLALYRCPLRLPRPSLAREVRWSCEIDA
jgi:glutamate dehydrogenase/leucine dehydrogenase